MRARRVGSVPSEVTLDEVKANARVTHDEDNMLIQMLIDAAHCRAEEETGRVFGLGEWVIEADVANDILPSPISPVVSAPEGWTLERRGRRYWLRGEWAPEVQVTVTAGEEMPHTVKQAVILLATHWYDNRAVMGENKVEMPYAVTSLLALNRRMFA